MSEEENKAMENLKQYNDKISNVLQSLSIEQAKLIENEKNMKSEINAQFNYLINTIVGKQEKILKQLNDETKNYQSQINKTSKMLQEKQEISTNIIASCNNMLRDNNMNKMDRKKQIISMAKQVINEPISIYRPQTIQCRFNQQETTKVKFILSLFIHILYTVYLCLLFLC